MDSDYTKIQEGLLNGKTTNKTYKGGYSKLSAETDSSFYQDSDRVGQYHSLDDESAYKKISTSDDNSEIYTRPQLKNDVSDEKKQAEEEISPSLTQSVYNKNTNPSKPEMVIEKCSSCQNSVMISKEATKFKCCYCKTLNDKTVKKPIQQRLFICGSCKQTISYIPVSNYVRCICGTINFVPSENQQQQQQVNVVPVNLYPNLSQSQQKPQVQQQTVYQQPQQQLQQPNIYQQPLYQQQQLLLQQAEKQKQLQLQLQQQQQILIQQQQQQQQILLQQQKLKEEELKKKVEQDEKDQLEKLAIYQKQQEELHKKYLQQQQVSSNPVQYNPINNVYDNNNQQYQNNPYMVITQPNIYQQQQQVQYPQLNQFSMTQSYYGYNPNQKK